uniref:Uncharacterized protein n=1 Tax=Strongyloides venezuelensis TaxID=75913 RepID=A0A0K0EVQ1_STRVS
MKIETDHGDDYLGLKFFRFTFSLAEIKVKRDLENTVIRLKVVQQEELQEINSRNINFNLENLIEQKASSITDDVKAQEKEDEELPDSLFENKNESSSTKIVEEVVGEITDSDESSDDELRHHYL